MKMRFAYIFVFLFLAVVSLVSQIGIFVSAQNISSCAKIGEQYSRVFVEEYPSKCCEGLKAWDSGMDTRAVVNGTCVHTNLVSGYPVGTCLSCGDNICDSIENICNCPEDCSNTPPIPSLSCNSLYWIDNENKSCGQKEFCGAYMYYGLRTFETKNECLRVVANKTREENGTKTFNLSNGRQVEIKIMPDVASQRAIERLGELNFTVELREVGNGNETRAVYEIKSEKEGKLLGLFKIKGNVSIQFDAEGNVKEFSEPRIKKPWWAFLASGI